MSSLSHIQSVLANLFKAQHTWTAKQSFSGYTLLGESSVKVKTLTGTTDAVAGNTVSVAHGVTLAKIISLCVLVNDGTTMYAPSSPTATEEFSFTADATNVNVINGVAAVTILSQPFVITVIYEE